MILSTEDMGYYMKISVEGTVTFLSVIHQGGSRATPDNKGYCLCSLLGLSYARGHVACTVFPSFPFFHFLLSLNSSCEPQLPLCITCFSLLLLFYYCYITNYNCYIYLFLTEFIHCCYYAHVSTRAWINLSGSSSLDF